MTTAAEESRTVRHLWLILPATTPAHRAAALAVFAAIRREFRGGFSWFDGASRMPFAQRDAVVGGTWFDTKKQCHEEDASIVMFVDVPERVATDQVACSMSMLVADAHIEYTARNVSQAEFYCAIQVGRAAFFVRAGETISSDLVP